jgi:hypothetical protein
VRAGTEGRRRAAEGWLLGSAPGRSRGGAAPIGPTPAQAVLAGGDGRGVGPVSPCCLGLTTPPTAGVPAPQPTEQAGWAVPSAPERHVPHREPSGRYQDTATGPPPLSERVTITLPVHPLKGVALPVYRFIRSQDGRRYVDVEHPAGQYMRLPLEWTDRAPPLVPPSVDGRAACLSVPALLELASAVQVALSGRQS